jgi:hypothetical protein
MTEAYPSQRSFADDPRVICSLAGGIMISGWGHYDLGQR